MWLTGAAPPARQKANHVYSSSATLRSERHQIQPLGPENLASGTPIFRSSEPSGCSTRALQAVGGRMRAGIKNFHGGGHVGPLTSSSLRLIAIRRVVAAWEQTAGLHFSTKLSRAQPDWTGLTRLPHETHANNTRNFAHAAGHVSPKSFVRGRPCTKDSWLGQRFDHWNF